MNKITFAVCILVVSLVVGVWSTLLVLNENRSEVKDLNSLSTLIEKVTPITVSITSTSTDGAITSARAWTGIIVSPEGIILTNKHLTGEWLSYIIEFHDGTKVSAKLLKTHPSLDLALLSIVSDTSLSLPVGTFINSEAMLRQWDRVIAIGNTLGLYPGSVTEGIISGLNRTVSFSGISMQWLIQTSIPMTLGNSGGPLVGEDGNIIGINTGIVWGSSQIGWALPLTQEGVDSFLQE